MINGRKLAWVACLLPFMAVSAQAVTLSAKKVSLGVDQSDDISMSRITGTPTVSVSNSSVASAEIVGTDLIVTGLGAGSTTVTVADDGRRRARLTVSVVVPMTLSSNSLWLTPGQSEDVIMTNAESRLKVKVSSKKVAAVKRSGDVLTVTGRKEGDADIELKGSSGEYKIEVVVSSSSPPGGSDDDDDGDSGSGGGSGGSTGSVSGNTTGRLLASNCFQCHGTYGSGGFDSIAGKNDIASELNEYVRGQEDPNGIMAAHVKGYTTEQLQAIATYLANP